MDSKCSCGFKRWIEYHGFQMAAMDFKHWAWKESLKCDCNHYKYPCWAKNHIIPLILMKAFVILWKWWLLYVELCEKLGKAWGYL